MPERSHYDQAAAIRELSAQLRAKMHFSGYQFIELSHIENADLFLAKAGDQIIEKLFTFERHGRVLALRPEFTASAAYRYLHSGLQHPVRWQFGGMVFQDQLSETHIQRYSVGAELIGVGGAGADAEIISLAAHAVMDMNLPDWTLAVGHIGLIRQLLSNFHLDARTRRFIIQQRDVLKRGEAGKADLLSQLAEYITHGQETPSGANTIDALDTGHMLGLLLEATGHAETMGGRTREEIATRLLQKRAQITELEQVAAALDFLRVWLTLDTSPEVALSQAHQFVEGDPLAEHMLDDWRALLAQLYANGIPPDRVRIQPDLARTWDYYSGIMFELRSGERVLGGGGRYDELAPLLGAAKDVPAVGFALYLEEMIASRPDLQPAAAHVIYLRAEKHQAAEAARWAAKLRQERIPVILPVEHEAIPESALVATVDAQGCLSITNITAAFDDVSVADRVREALLSRGQSYEQSR